MVKSQTGCPLTMVLPTSSNAIIMPELYVGILLKRYKRFLADVLLEDGTVVTAHSANTGSMLECSEPGRRVWLSFHDNPGRKYKYSWDIIDMGSSLVGVNTLLPNRLVKLSIEAGLIDELSGYDKVVSEIKINNQSRLDLALYKDGRRNCFVEIKNCTYVKNAIACFPDAVTKRGLKHLKELQQLVDEDNRAIIFFLVQRMDASSFEPADLIDPEYGKALRSAFENGVEVLVYDTIISTEYIRLGSSVRYNLSGYYD